MRALQRSRYYVLKVTSRLFTKLTFSKVYKISGTSNLDPNPIFRNPFAYPFFRYGFQSFKKDLKKHTLGQRSKTYYKFGDGDYHFLKGNHLGSAAPGNRALGRVLEKEELRIFQCRAQLADAYMCELYPFLRLDFSKVIQTNKRIWPAEYAYAVISTKWIFREFGNEIGLIGSAQKLDLINLMMQFSEYREFLGIESFSDYIKIPQKYSCDDLPRRIEEISEQLKTSNSRIFLLGVGHLKSGIISELPKLKEGVYLDVGTGIDAIAGIIDPKRPYFGNWTNYYIPNHPLYDELDLLNYNQENRKPLVGDI